MDKLLIVDGMNLFFQMFFGMPSRIINKQGKAIQGVLGFVGALIKIIKITAPSHVVVLFDSEHKNERTEVLPEYKANRINYGELIGDECPFSQLNDVYNALKKMNIKFSEILEYETDDIIASYVYKFYKDCKIVVASFDSDFFQLINDNVNVLRYKGKKTIICDCDYIKEKYNIEPHQFADLKSLMGDVSDNIKGIKNVGSKTAAALLNQFGNLENIIKNHEKILKQSVKNAIACNLEKLRINYEIIKLKRLNFLPFNFSELKFSFNGTTSTEVLKSIGLL